MSRSEERYPQVTIYGHIKQVDASTTSRAETLFSEGRTCCPSELIFRPALTFLKAFFVRRKIFEGPRGLIFSVLEAYEEFITYLKLWELSYVKQGDNN